MKKSSALLITITLIIAASALALIGMQQTFQKKPPQFNNIPVHTASPSPPISPSIPSPQSKNTTGLPLRLPDNFSIITYAKGLGAPRVMAFAPGGKMIVSIPSQGKVVSLSDTNGDGIAESIQTVVSGLNRPHGIAFRCQDENTCQIYIGESHQISAFDYDEQNHKAINKKTIAELPDRGNHFTRTLMFLPYPAQDRLLVSVGSSCNVCSESDWRRAKILVIDINQPELKIFGSGLRNSVFMSIHPVNGKVWATDMGRDWLGDNLPPDEINIIEEGRDYGWPYFYGKNVRDADFEPSIRIKTESDPSFIDIPAHSAPLGLAFFPEEGWPEDFWYNMLVAYHGSWNRSEPTGYKIVRYQLDAQGNYLGENDFITGWITKDSVLGRPVDIMILPGGTIFISDDKAGAIYKVQYSGL